MFIRREYDFIADFEWIHDSILTHNHFFTALLEILCQSGAESHLCQLANQYAKSVGTLMEREDSSP
jgi:hypothetical protein